jgi:hypothetical protein
VEDLFVFNDTICNFIGTCNKQSPYAYSSSTHRFPDERTPIEATPLSATSAELGLGLGLGLGWLSCLGLNFLLASVSLVLDTLSNTEFGWFLQSLQTNCRPVQQLSRTISSESSTNKQHHHLVYADVVDCATSATTSSP